MVFETTGKNATSQAQIAPLFHFLDLEVEKRLPVIGVHAEQKLHARCIIAGHAGLIAFAGGVDESAHRIAVLVDKASKAERRRRVILKAVVGKQKDHGRLRHLRAAQERVFRDVALLDRFRVCQEGRGE